VPLTDVPATCSSPAATLLLGNADGEVDAATGSRHGARARPFKRGLLVKFDGVEDATRRGCCGRYLLACDGGAAPLEEGELFYHQLLGARSSATGRCRRPVREVYETEPAHLLEVDDGDGRAADLVPFARTIVKFGGCRGGGS
jgi:ribosomal 30S subunit maturation factor RimM